MKPTEYRSCTIKKPFRTQREAMKSAKAMNRNAHAGKKPVHAYECGYCGCWHVGHPMERGTIGENEQLQSGHPARGADRP